MLDANHREQIERTIGRALQEDELARVGAPAQLTAAARQIAEELSRKQLVLCAIYLKAIASMRLIDAVDFMDAVHQRDKLLGLPRHERSDVDP